MPQRSGGGELGEAVGQVLVAIVQAVTDPIERHLRLPPREQAISRAQYATAVLIIAAYGLIFAEPLTGANAGGLLATFLRAPATAPQTVWLPIVLEASVLSLGGLWLISGLRGSGGGPRNGLKAFWAAGRAALLAAVMVWARQAPADWHGWVALLDLVLVVFIGMEVMGFFLHLRGAGKARRIVARHIRRTAVTWRPAGSRRWWQWW